MIARVVGHVGPSMLLTSLSESLAFFLGELTLHRITFILVAFLRDDDQDDNASDDEDKDDHK